MLNDLIEGLIRFIVHHRELAYLLLFLGSLFDTLIGFSFFVWGEVFFLAGSILAGMGILDIWAVMATLYAGGSAGDNLSYYLGRLLGPLSFRRVKKLPVIRRFFSFATYKRSARFFRKYGAVSVLIGRLLGPLAWITPFLAGQYEIPYRKFLIFDTIGVLLGIGEFIVAGYFFGKHYKVLLDLIETYSIVFLFVVTMGILLYLYLKRSGMLQQFLYHLRQERIRLFHLVIHNAAVFAIVSLLLYALFLLFIFFVDPPESKSDFKAPPYYTVKAPKLDDCRKMGTYYRSRPGRIIQPVNVVLESDLNLSQILDGDWSAVKIFLQDRVSLRNYLHLLWEKLPPVSSLYLQGLPQNVAYQYRSDSLSRREHIRFWIFRPAGRKRTEYYGSISYDNGYDFSFYNYFFTPVHKIDKAIDKSREFFRHYLMTRPDLSVQCREIRTPCRVAKISGDNEEAEEQMYYTDGKVLKCTVQKKKRGER